METEILLTGEEVKYILNRAKYSLLNNPGFVSQSTNNYYDITHITPYNKLIFIAGNRFTGLHHIIFRHDYFSNEHSRIHSHFVETSKFHEGSHRLLHYSEIAEHLYSSDNLNLVNNKREREFDMYSGTLPQFHNKEYILLLYKNTKIVHTLFPNEPIKNKKRKKLRRGKMQVQINNLNTVIGLIPYYDVKNKLCYCFRLTYLENEKIEKLAILIYENDISTKLVELKDQIRTANFNIRTHLDEIEHNPLHEIENLIDLIENGTIK